MTNSVSSPGGDNSSDTESAPSPSQADASKSGDSKRAEATAGDVQSSDQDKGLAGSARALEPSYGDLRVKEEKSPESEAGSQEARAASFTDSVHPKLEPQDVDMKSGEVQVKMEPEVKERGEKGEHGGREHHSDNDSSATCSADEDVEAEPERRFVFSCCRRGSLQERDVLAVDIYPHSSAGYSPWRSRPCSTLRARCWWPPPSKPISTSSSCTSGRLPSHPWLVTVSGRSVCVQRWITVHKKITGLRLSQISRCWQCDDICNIFNSYASADQIYMTRAYVCNWGSVCMRCKILTK